MQDISRQTETTWQIETAYFLSLNEGLCNYVLYDYIGFALWQYIAANKHIDRNNV